MIISTDLSFPVLEIKKNVFIIFFIFLNALYYTLCQNNCGFCSCCFWLSDKCTSFCSDREVGKERKTHQQFVPFFFFFFFFLLIDKC